MRKEVIIQLICWSSILLVTSCHNAEEVRETEIPVSMNEKAVSYIDFYLSQNEKILQYSYIDCSFGASKEPQLGLITKNFDRNTFSLATTKTHTAITLEDSYDIQQEGVNTHVNLLRKVQLRDDSTGTDTSAPSLPTTTTIVVRTAQPIYFIRPYTTECHPIPLCYYSDMEIAWNADYENTDGVIVIAEWNGINNDSDPVDEYRVNAKIVDDMGSAVLEDDIFDFMPDGALVHLWLLRANIVQFMSEDVEFGIDEFLTKIETGEINLEEILTDNPEIMMQLQTVSVASGAVTHLPIFLVRDI
ncbi:MAG: hypothetical protein ACI3Z5_06230 [Paludibacteraceae bacterium]